MVDIQFPTVEIRRGKKERKKERKKKKKNFNGPHMVQMVKMRHRANFMAIGQAVAVIWQFVTFSIWRPSAIADLVKKMEILTADRVKRVSLHRHAIFHGDRSNCC